MPHVSFPPLASFPDWFQQTLIFAWGAALLATPLVILTKAAQHSSVVALLRACPGVFNRLTAFLKQQLHDPYRYPRIERALQYGSVLQAYAMPFLLLVHFTLLVVLAVMPSKLLVWQRAAVILFAFSCAYMAGVLKAQGGRELFSLRNARDT